MAIAVVLCSGLSQVGTLQAAELGRIVVRSTVGEPLQAEIDIADLSADEFASLRVRLGSADAFRSAGLTFNPALAQAQLSTLQRPDGRYYLRLTTAQALTDPFMDVVVEAQWASGRVVRSYTLLLNQTKRPSETLEPAVPASTREYFRTEPLSARSASQAITAEQPSTEPVGARKVQVQPGDTASRIASAYKHESVSLDQMLLAMLRGNPRAFLGRNVNRIKAGALVEIPDEEQAQAIDDAEARQVIAAQSRDFNEFRRRLAEQAPVAVAGGNERESGGRVQTEVLAQGAAGTASDRLTLSKGAVASGSDEETLALQKQAQEASSRAAELSRNIEELGRLKAGSPDAAASGQSSGGGPLDQETGWPARLWHDASGKASSLIDWLITSPLTLPIAGGLLALLGLIGFTIFRRRAIQPELDSSLMEGRHESEPFLGTDTVPPLERDGNLRPGPAFPNATGEKHAGDTDPVAEADVYLAYGRDLQAEEILKEALSRHPERIAIHLKLMSIYAKRRDVLSFESMVMGAHALTKGKGPEWANVCEMGRGLDANTPFYSQASREAGGAVNSPAQAKASPSSRPAGLDLDLDMPGGRTSAGSSQDGRPTPADHSSNVYAQTANRMNVRPAPSRPGTEDLDEDSDLEQGIPAQHPAKGAPVTDESARIDWDALNLELDQPATRGNSSGETPTK